MIPVAAAGAWDEGRPLRREARKKREGALASWTGAARCRLCRPGPVDELPASRARPLVHGLADHDVEERASVFGRPQLLGKVAPLRLSRSHEAGARWAGAAAGSHTLGTSLALRSDSLSLSSRVEDLRHPRRWRSRSPGCRRCDRQHGPRHQHLSRGRTSPSDWRDRRTARRRHQTDAS